MELLDIRDAVFFMTASGCKKRCSIVAVSVCEECPSFGGIYVERAGHTFANMERALLTGGKKQVKCIYPEEK